MSRTAQTARALEAAFAPAVIETPKPFDFAKEMADLSIGWAKRHGHLMAAIYLLEIDLRYGDVERAKARIAAAIEREAAA